MASATYVNPVYGESFADPFVWKWNGVYYAVGTGLAASEGHAGSTVFPVLTSEDLVSWRPLGDALIRPDASLGDTFWAPEVACRDSTFFMYYSVGHADAHHQLRVAIADRPEGPYRDAAALTDLATCPFAIDASPFCNVDGRYYLFYARDFLDTENGFRAGTALVVQELAPDMTSFVSDPRTVLRARWDWQRFAADRPMYGSTYDWHTLEGPCVVRRDGTYYLMYSGGCWHTERYGVDYATAPSILGPWTDTSTADGPRLLRGIAGKVIGPGHHSVVEGPRGDDLYLCYHAWDAAMTARRLCIDLVVVENGTMRSDGPTFTPRPAPPR